MTMNASYFRRNGTWEIDSQTVAHVFRDAWTMKDLLQGRRTYFLTVAPGMDTAVAVAACIFVHERVSEGGGSGRGGGGWGSGIGAAVMGGAIGGA